MTNTDVHRVAALFSILQAIIACLSNCSSLTFSRVPSVGIGTGCTPVSCSLFCVMVPVLSEKSTVMRATSSDAASLLTNTPCRQAQT